MAVHQVFYVGQSCDYYEALSFVVLLENILKMIFTITKFLYT